MNPFKYPKYRILEQKDQYGNVIYIAQYKPSFFAEDLDVRLFSQWVCLAKTSTQGVNREFRLEHLSVLIENDYNFTRENAEYCVSVKKEQDKKSAELAKQKKLLKQKERAEKLLAESKEPKFKTTKKTYV